MGLVASWLLCGVSTWLLLTLLVSWNAEEGEEPKVEKHPVCTKSLELNADALLGLLDWANGGFVDIPALQNEAIISQHHTVK